MSNLYYPALLIGCGGSGVATLRYIRGLARYDQELNRMITEGSIQLVAIDTDPKSNEMPQAVDPQLVDHLEGLALQEEPIPRELPKIDNWVLVNREAINNALPKVYETVRRMQEYKDPQDGDDTEKLIHRCVAQWFPVSEIREEKHTITQGHSKSAGAAQWRPLGRLGLFLHAANIKNTLKRACDGVYDPSAGANGALRAFIICSLAGGTGSGMFWDIAFMLHMIDDRIRTTGLFLLDGPFVAVDEAHRIGPNVYGALKELAAFKNWRVSEGVKVEYPISERGEHFTAKPGSSPVFSMVYLYQGFKPSNLAKDKQLGAIQVTYLRMAQNLLAQIRRDLHAELDVGANNVGGDADVMPASREAAYIFSTSGTTTFPVTDITPLVNYLEQEWLKRLQGAVQQEQEQRGPAPDLSRLFTPIDAPDRGQGRKDLRDLLASWLESIQQQLDSQTSPLLTGWREKLELARAAVIQAEEELDQEKLDPEWEPGLVVEQYLPRELKERIESVVASDGHRDGGLTEPGQEYARRIDLQVRHFIEGLGDVARRMEGSRVRLDEAHLLRLETLVTQVGNLSGEEGERPVRFTVSEEMRRLWRHRQRRGVRPLIVRLTEGIFPLAHRQNAGLRKEMRVLRTFLASAQEQLAIPQVESQLDVKRMIQGAVRGHLEELRQIVRELRQRDNDWAERSQLLDEVYQNLHRREDHRVAHGVEMDLGPLLLALAENNDPSLDQSAREREQSALSIRKRLIARLETTVLAKSHHLQELLPCLEWSKSEERDDKLERCLKEYSLKVQQLRNSGNPDVKLLINHLLDWVEQCHPGLDNVYARQLELEESIALGRAILEVMVAFARDKGDVLRLRLDRGWERLKERLRRCRSEVFRAGVIDNTLNKKHLLIIPPQQKYRTPDMEEELHTIFRQASQQVLQSTARVSSRQTVTPVIYYEDLFRSAEEIVKIQDYHQSYIRRPKDERQLFHVFRQGLSLPDIIGLVEPKLPVLCGNVGCSKDLRGLRRSELLCPGCARPIWNRCGNEGCKRDDIKELLDEERGKRGDEGKTPYQCPACGDVLRNYWWYCTDPAHQDKAIATDKESCPLCLNEYRNGTRPIDQVRNRTGKHEFDCPGCLQMGYEGKGRKVAMVFKTFFDDGVNGHQSTQFMELVLKEKRDRHYCLNQGTRHYLFPTCPKPNKEGGGPHHLYRQQVSGRFICPQHPELHFLECFHCGNPVQDDFEVRDEQGGVVCSRCRRTVFKCDYCTSKYGKVYAPWDLGNPQVRRCPNCSNLLVANRRRTPDAVTVERGLVMRPDEPRGEVTQKRKPGFCRNLFACRAARDLWYTAANYHLTKCRVCASESPAYLLDREQLGQYVKACPLCLILLGLVDESVQQHVVMAPAALYPLFSNSREEPRERFQENCKICGARSGLILKWMRRDGLFTHLPTQPQESLGEGQPAAGDPDGTARRRFESWLSEVEGVNLPVLDFNVAQELLQRLHQEESDEAVYHAFRKSRGFDQVKRTLIPLQEELFKAFNPRAIAVRGLEHRLRNLDRIHQEIWKRENQEEY